MIKNQTSIVDDRGYNQGFRETKALKKRMERRGDWLIAQMDTKAAKKVMEIGCGTGFLSYYIAHTTHMQVTGSDMCRPFIKEARQKYVLPNLHFEVLDFNEPGVSAKGSVDYIIGNGILHHLYNTLSEVLPTLKTLLNPGGKIIFMEPNIYNPYIAAIFKSRKLRQWAKLEPDEMAFSKKFITGKLAEAGFSKIDIQYKDFLLPGVPEVFINPLIHLGNFLEKTPLKILSQSLLISAAK